ncbi:MAG: pyridoxamine 5'-phosphate oxidase family protein [bacterium]|nr:pyridoxamine 5'-phosphate oxidase family protein [bacterium]
MSKVVDFLNEIKVYYLATVEEGEARVRPIGATVEFKGRVYLATNNQKDMFKQITNNPSIAVSGFNGDKWIRITGNAVVDNTIEAKSAMLEANPDLKHMYSVDDGIFEVFYIDNMKATLSSFAGDTIELEN